MNQRRNNQKYRGLGRYIGFVAVLFAMFVYLVSGLVNLQLRQEDYYQEKAEATRTKSIALRGKRGNIISSDSVILAEDELIYNVTFQKDATDNTKALYRQYTASILETIRIVEKNGGTISVSYVIEREGGFCLPAHTLRCRSVWQPDTSQLRIRSAASLKGSHVRRSRAGAPGVTLPRGGFMENSPDVKEKCLTSGRFCGITLRLSS